MPLMRNGFKIIQAFQTVSDLFLLATHRHGVSLSTSRQLINCYKYSYNRWNASWMTGVSGQLCASPWVFRCFEFLIHCWPTFNPHVPYPHLAFDCMLRSHCKCILMFCIYISHVYRSPFRATWPDIRFSSFQTVIGNHGCLPLPFDIR